MSESRVYLINEVSITEGVKSETRLVRANTKHQALKYVAENYFAVRVASQDDLINLVSRGVKVEIALGETNDRTE